MKLQDIQALVNQVALPANDKLAEALKLARHQKFLELAYGLPYSPAIPYVSLKDCVENYEKLPPIARSFMSKANAEFQWASQGKVYPYNDYTSWMQIYIVG